MTKLAKVVVCGPVKDICFFEKEYLISEWLFTH